jgi:hypothetical protein
MDFKTISTREWNEKLCFNITTFEKISEYLENLKNLTGSLMQKIINSPPLRIQPLQTPNGVVKVVQYTQRTLYSHLKNIAYEDNPLKDEPCMGHLFTKEIISRIDEIQEVLKKTNTDTNTRVETTRAPKVFEDRERRGIDPYINVLRTNIETLKTQHQDELNRREITIRLQVEEITSLRETIIKNNAENLWILENNMLKEKLAEVMVDRKQQIEDSRCLSEIKFSYEGFTEYNTLFHDKFNSSDNDDFKKYLLRQQRNIKPMLSRHGEWTIKDYEEVIGKNFNLFNSIIYKYVSTHKTPECELGLLEFMKELTKYDCRELEEMITIIRNATNDMEIIFDCLKKNLKKRGMFMRRVGDCTEYYGMWSHVVFEKEQLEFEVKKLKKIIDELVGELKKNKRKYMKANLPKIVKEWCETEGKESLFDIVNFLRRKLYRRKIVEKTFGPINYKLNQKYAGITINKWRFEYLCSKSLGAVINKPVEALNTPLEMKLAIKCLRKLNNIMDCKKALLWARHFFSRRLGRQPVPRKQVYTQEEQNKRFLDTYYFEEDYQECLKDVSMLQQDFNTKYMSLVKNLDKEVNANLIGRFHNDIFRQSYNENKKQKIGRTVWSSYWQKEYEKIPKDVARIVTTKRNPVYHYKKAKRIVDTCYNYLSGLQRQDLLSLIETKIPFYTYDRDQLNEPPEKYVKFCEKAIVRYNARQPLLFNERMNKIMDENLGVFISKLEGNDESDNDGYYDPYLYPQRHTDYFPSSDEEYHYGNSDSDFDL